MENNFNSWVKPEIKEGELTKFNWMVQGVDNFKLGKGTDIGAFVYINARAGVTIGEGVKVGGGTKIYSVSTIDGKEGQVILKDNCKVGANSVIMPGVTIGENSIIGALSFVNKNIPDNVIAFGSPVKVVKKI